MFVAVQDPTQPDSPVVSLFNSPQNYPFPPGYIGWIDDSDARVVAYEARAAALAQGVK